MPKTFVLSSITANEDYYFRYLDGKTPRIKFNVPDPGTYNSNVPVEVVKVAPIEIPDKMPTLPPANRDRWQECKKVYNPEMDSTTTTPIRIYSNMGIIEYGDRFLSFIKPIQIFLEFHERGHQFYVEEENCDMFALVNFINSGYNQTTAYYALDNILSRSPQKIERLKTLFNNIQKMRK
jgi:hypothetical protein